MLQRVKKERNVLQTIKRRNANWIGQILRRNCFLNHVTEEKIEGRTVVKGRRGRRREKLPDDINPLAPELFFFLILAHPVYKM